MLASPLKRKTFLKKLCEQLLFKKFFLLRGLEFAPFNAKTKILFVLFITYCLCPIHFFFFYNHSNIPLIQTTDLHVHVPG